MVNTLTEFATVNLKVPSALVVVPAFDDLATTLAPAIAAPFSSVTFPVTVRFCAKDCVNASVTHKIMTTNFLIFWFLM